MADTPKPGETENQKPLENDAKKPTTPHIEEKKTDDSEIEELRKKAEQAEMRVNQLSNQLKAKDDAEAKAKAKELEKNEEFKTLYEQTQAELEDIKQEREAEEQKQAIAKSSQAALSDYPDEVKAIAEDTGLSLKDVTDDSVAEFKAKLDKIQTRLGNNGVRSNNPQLRGGQKEYTGEELRQILADPTKRDAYYRAKGGVTATMMNPQS
jgi:hypothetical protein